MIKVIPFLSGLCFSSSIYLLGYMSDIQMNTHKLALITSRYLKTHNSNNNRKSSVTGDKLLTPAFFNSRIKAAPNYLLQI